MFSLSLFISYISTILILNGYFFILLIIIPIGAYLICVEYFEFYFCKKTLTIYLLCGIITGGTYGYYTYNSFDRNNYKSTDLFRSARIIGTTASSITVELKDKQRKRIKIIRPQYKENNSVAQLYLFDRVDFTCSRWKSKKTDDIYATLEELQAIYNVCTSSTIYSREPLFRNFNLLRSQIQLWANQKLNLLGDQSYARGFLLSDTKNINRVELNIFRHKMGIAHLFSASGLHMGFLYATCFLPLSFFGLKRTGVFLGLVMCFFYLCLLDFQIPLLRSFFFISAFVFLKLINRQSHGRYTLYFTIIFLENIFPFSSFLPSFILSFLITLTILLFYPQLEKIIILKTKFIRENLALTISASIGSSFLSLYIFHYFHPVSILYNFFLVPFSGPYLASVFLYFIVPYFKYIILAGDYFYRKSAWIHYLLFEKNVPLIHFEFAEIWLLFFSFLTIFLIYHTIKKQYWYLRKYYIKSYLMISLIFLTNYLFIKIPVSGRVAFPYGVIEYKNQNYYIAGSPADFYADNFKYLMENNILPFKKIYAPDSFSKLLHENVVHPELQISDEPSLTSRNVVFLNDECFIFIYKSYPQKNLAKNISSCKNIFLVHSKKIAPDIEIWKNFFSAFSCHGNVQLMTFLKWNWEYENEKNP